MFSGKRFALIAGLALALIVPMQSPAIADYTSDANAVENTLLPEQEMFWLTEPIKNSEYSLYNSLYRGTGEKPWNYSFAGAYNNLNVPVSHINMYKSEDPKNQVTCEGWSDPRCRQAGNRFYAELFFPPCVEDASSSCIESLNISANGKSSAAALIRTTDTRPICRATDDPCKPTLQKTKFPSIPSLNIPAGSAPSLWTTDGVANAAGSNTYLASVKVRVSGTLDSRLNLTNLYFDDFNASVIPYLEISGDFRPGERWLEGGRGTWGYHSVTNHLSHSLTDNSGCAWKEDGKCGIAAAFAPDTKVELGLRVPKELDGWLEGRLSDASIDLSRIDSKLNRLIISGSAIEVPVTGTFFHPIDVGFKYEEAKLSNTYSFSWGRNYEGQTYAVGTSVQMLPVFEKYLGDKALGRVSLWSVDSSTGGYTCENKKIPRLEGLLTTNAMVYNGGLPTYKKGALSYQVGGLHYNHDGTVFKGSYDFIMRSDTARCIYGFTKAPVQVAVTVTDVNGVQSASTSSVSESGGWLRIRARDFTFSTPTITAKITQKLSTSVKNDKISQKSLAKIAKVSIGKKDKVTVSVSGGNKKFAKVTSGNVSFKKNGTYQVKIKVKHYKGTTETATISVKVK
jgi:hypothetical protein